MIRHLKRLVLPAAIAAMCLVPRGAALAQLSPAWVNGAQAHYRTSSYAFRQQYDGGASFSSEAAQPPAATPRAPLATQSPLQSWRQGGWQGRAASWQNRRQWQTHSRVQAVPQLQRQPLGGWMQPLPTWQPRPSWQAGWPSPPSWQAQPGNWQSQGATPEESLGQTVGSLIDGVVNGAE